MNTELIMHNLKIVAMVGEQDKLVTAPRFGLRTPTTFRAMLRRWNGESRATDLQNLRSLLSSAVTVAQLHETKRRVVGFAATRSPSLADKHNDRLIEAICNALGGMNTLTRTYHDDQETCAEIELLIQEVKDHVNGLRPGTFAEQGSAARESAGPAEHGRPLYTPGMGTPPSASPPRPSPPDDP